MVTLIAILNLLGSATTKLYIETPENEVLELNPTDSDASEKLDFYKSNYVDKVESIAKGTLSIKLK